jgi:hypothetical protein
MNELCVFIDMSGVVESSTVQGSCQWRGARAHRCQTARDDSGTAQQRTTFNSQQFRLAVRFEVRYAAMIAIERLAQSSLA